MLANTGFIKQTNKLVSSNLTGTSCFVVCLILRIDSMSFNASLSEAGLAPGVSELVPVANVAEQVSKGKVYEITNLLMPSKLTGSCRCASVSVFCVGGGGISFGASHSSGVEARADPEVIMLVRSLVAIF